MKTEEDYTLCSYWKKKETWGKPCPLYSEKQIRCKKCKKREIITIIIFCSSIAAVNALFGWFLFELLKTTI